MARSREAVGGGTLGPFQGAEPSALPLVERTLLDHDHEMGEFFVRPFGFGQRIADDVRGAGEQLDEPGLFGGAVAGHGIGVWYGTLSMPSGSTVEIPERRPSHATEMRLPGADNLSAAGV